MFDPLKKSIKEKWLDYYDANSSWLNIAIQKNGNFRQKVGDGDKIRPHAMIILGVITALEPNLMTLMPSLCQLNSDPDELIKALELNFEPKEELEKLKKQRAESQTNNDSIYLDQLRQNI